jgi:hypothetical protein
MCLRVRVRVGQDEGEGVGSPLHSHTNPHLNAKQLLSGSALLVDGQKK